MIFTDESYFGVVSTGKGAIALLKSFEVGVDTALVTIGALISLKGDSTFMSMVLDSHFSLNSVPTALCTI